MKVTALRVASILKVGLRAILRNKLRSSLTMLGIIIGVGCVITVIAVAFGGLSMRSAPDAIVVGSKNFTEQIILGELFAQSLEARGIVVTRRLNLGGTFICDRALRSGDIDVYPEYTGTALTAVFHETVGHDRGSVLERTRRRYAEGGVTVLEPLGFDNTFAILVRRADAESLGLRSIGDLKQVQQRWQPGRPGRRGLQGRGGIAAGRQTLRSRPGRAVGKHERRGQRREIPHRADRDRTRADLGSEADRRMLGALQRRQAFARRGRVRLQLVKTRAAAAARSPVELCIGSTRR